MPEPLDHLTRAQTQSVTRARKARNYAILAVLVGVCGLFYALAIVKLGGH